MKKIAFIYETDLSYKCIFVVNSNDYFVVNSKNDSVPDKYIDGWGQKYEGKEVFDEGKIIIMRFFCLYLNRLDGFYYFKKAKNYTLLDKDKHLKFMGGRRSNVNYDRMKEHVVDIFYGNLELLN